MNKTKGYIKTSRVTFATELWNEPRRFSKFEAWTDILRRTWYADGDDLPVNKGEAILVTRELASAWDWGLASVHRFLSRLLDAGMLEATSRQSVFLVRNAERNIIRYDKRNAERNAQDVETQEENEVMRNAERNDKRNAKRKESGTSHLIIDKKENNKEKEACACAGPLVAPPAPATLPDGTPLPYGMTLRQWERFRSWAEKNVPTLMEVGITPTDYAIMRGKALSDVKKIATILLAMEKAGRPHRVRDEYIRRVERWREDKFNGLYG